uniref:Putative (H+)-ATPase G subunit n=1 Tax=Trypanosoma congolense (strain IL3000) TaxID=1068625 RepID=G0URJ8_TRYCI|nr:putative (H+)-ATPase G subunit [Trypanosoma congolense IL3000]
MPPKYDNVQRLLDAEKRRNDIIAKAKAEKQAKVKQAKVDAECEVAAFHAEKEREYEAYRQQQESLSEAEKEQLRRETDMILQQITAMAAKRTQIVEDMMTNMILQCDSQ